MLLALKHTNLGALSALLNSLVHIRQETRLTDSIWSTEFGTHTCPSPHPSYSSHDEAKM